MTKGNAANGFSFKGADPHNAIISLLNAASPTGASPSSTYSSILSSHSSDYAALNKFKLNIGQSANLNTPTDQLISSFVASGNNGASGGNPYLEWLLFNFGRYLLFSSARGTLPANLQGKWSPDASAAWGADYHANINLQMNYWSAFHTNLDVQKPLFNYIQQNWAPRGAQTAALIYNINRGWVTHDEMDIFGYTGQKGDGYYMAANFPQAAVWMMLHVWDQFDFYNDVSWFKSQGYPLLKGVTQFHLDYLVNDAHFNDGTLVTAPCNSPEQSPITFGCSIAQQLYWMLFSAIQKGFAASGDTDTSFLNEVNAAKAKLDPGIHIGSWGQLQEWKYDMDSSTDQHRHLSHLIGLYPGYSVASYTNQTSYSKAQVINATTTSLTHRGNGTTDSNAGWEKMWRAACWAQLSNPTQFYLELTWGIDQNFASNLFSMYSGSNSGGSAPFQIDANLGFPAAVINALINAPDTPTYTQPLVVNVLPALPGKWATGSITNARVRGGLTVNLSWSNMKPTTMVIIADSSVVARPVQIVYAGQTVSSFTTSGGMSKTVTF